MGKTPDPLNPEHYKTHASGIECIEVTGRMGFCLGNAIKYLWRCDQKGGIEDLQKARWYIDREISQRLDDQHGPANRHSAFCHICRGQPDGSFDGWRLEFGDGGQWTCPECVTPKTWDDMTLPFGDGTSNDET